VFASEVMPSFFKEAKYESFQRALYRWGFIKSHRKTKKDSIDGKQRSFTYHHTGNMFAKNDWEKCSVLSYSKALKSAKDMINNMSYIGVKFQPLDVQQRRVSLTYDTGTEKDSGKQRGLGCLPEVPSIFSSPLDTIQTRRIGNPNFLAIDDINFENSNVDIPSTFALPNLLSQSSSLHQIATIPMEYPRLDIDAMMMMGPRLNPGQTSAQNMANSEYAKSILENAYRALANDTCFD